MSFWINLAIVLHVLLAFAIIGLVLLQHGKGADMGSGFGGGASGSLFGATGSANFLSRTTAVLATIFFISSLGLAYVATNKPREGAGVMESVREKPAAVPEKPNAAAEPRQAPPAEGSKARDVPQ